IVRNFMRDIPCVVVLSERESYIESEVSGIHRREPAMLRVLECECILDGITMPFEQESGI
ncbi:MAG: hypothetical protein ACFNXW_09370, partial [Rothia dentocariosa]